MTTDREQAESHVTETVSCEAEHSLFRETLIQKLDACSILCLRTNAVVNSFLPYSVDFPSPLPKMEVQRQSNLTLAVWTYSSLLSLRLDFQGVMEIEKYLQ